MMFFAAFSPADSARGQTTDAQVVDLIPGILSNNVSNLKAVGDSLWVGPFLDLTVDGGATWTHPAADTLFGTPNRVFSLDASGPVVWAALGFNDTSSGQSIQAAAGFLVSTDGGRTFSFRFPQLDSPADTSIVYGVSTLPALPVVVPQQSAPFDIDYDPVNDEVWVAGWASGIRRSADGGKTWQRVVLPPDELEAVFPDTLYNFVVEPQRGGNGSLNYLGFSVLVDESGTVWAGTPRGINRSTDGGLSWQRFSADGTAKSLTGNWVIAIDEQPLPGNNAIWMASWNAGDGGANQQFGVTVTRDGGETFEQALLGVQALGFAFRGETVYVAARDQGLLISDDSGNSWRSVIDFRDQARPDQLVRPGAEVLSVATTRNALWVGTEDGLLKSLDGGATWSIFRVEVPLKPDVVATRVPRVDTFAYPNPFSPAGDRFVRVRYQAGQGGSVRLRVFDFGMNLVRELHGDEPGGEQEISWDGIDKDGLRVANGVYFYAVEAGGKTQWGKILIVE